MLLIVIIAASVTAGFCFGKAHELIVHRYGSVRGWFKEIENSQSDD